MESQLSGLGSLACDYTIPQPDASEPVISRWSETKIGQPALVVRPKTEKDVQASISVARDNSLEVVVAGGTHGTFVTVGPKTLYLDMRGFKHIQLSKEDGTVRVGGGVLCGEMMEALAKEDYYTPIPNNNAIGAVGCVLGGGSTPWNGLHGWMADIVKSFRIVTSQGEILDVGASSESPNLELFNTLCGAGHGFCVITEMTTLAFPISSLNMTEDKVSKRSLVFPKPAIEAAANTFLSLYKHRNSPAASTSMTFVCTAPGSAEADPQVIIAVESMYFGPAEEAEKEAAPTYQEDILKQSIVAKTDLAEMSTLNDRFKPYEAHGGHKAIASCKLGNIEVDTILKVFESWYSIMKRFPDASKSPLMLSAYNSSKHAELGNGRKGVSFLKARERELGGQLVIICEKEESMSALTGFMEETMDTFRGKNPEEAPRSFANNLRFNMNMGELFDDESWAESKRIKETWDPQGLFWSPYSKA